MMLARKQIGFVMLFAGFLALVTLVSNRHLESGVHAWRSFTREMGANGITVEKYQQDYRLASAPATA
jgi:hypothetical protein